MDIEKDSLKKQIREMTQLGYIAPEDLPSMIFRMAQFQHKLNTGAL